MEVVFNVTDITPTYNGSDLTLLAFTITATDGTNSSNQRVIYDGHFPAPTDPTAGYLGAEMLNLCEGLSDELNVKSHLTMQILSSRTPMYTPPVVPVMSDDEKKTLWMSQIDANAALVYNQFTRFDVEYEQREAAAKAYKDAGYTGDPTVWLTAFADSNGISYQMCADLILSQAATLRAAVVQLGVLRMNKYKVKNAATIEEADQQFHSIINDIATLARSLP